MIRNILVNTIIIFLFTVNAASAQSNFRATDVKVRVTGTSTLHDWEMESSGAESQVSFRMDEQGNPEHIESVSLRLDKTSLKSDKSGLDRRAYDALDARRHPEIRFSANGGGQINKNGDRYSIATTGELTIAGVTRQVKIDAVGINGDDDRLVISGSTRLKMSDFNIDPPVMFLGTLRTGDEITIEYELIYSRN